VREGARERESARKRSKTLRGFISRTAQELRVLLLQGQALQGERVPGAGRCGRCERGRQGRGCHAAFAGAA